MKWKNSIYSSEINVSFVLDTNMHQYERALIVDELETFYYGCGENTATQICIFRCADATLGRCVRYVSNGRSTAWLVSKHLACIN